MFTSTLRALVLLLAISGWAIAAPPNTLGYQGRLADAGGQPITASLNITFRLYDVASSGTALWSETQSNVPVDGGNLAVELGQVTPLPASIWGRQLYLGLQIAGDSEMLPRPPLTAAPFALRAAGTMKNTIVVSAEGTPTENGAALLAAVAGISGASATAPVALELDAGTFDLGNARLNLPSFVTIAGRSQDATVITSSFGLGTLLLSSNSHARRLTARNTGIPPADTDFTYGIGAFVDGTLGLVQNVSLEDVTGEAIAASGTLGARHGISLCTEDSRVTNAFGRGVGGNFSFGMRSDCGNNANSTSLFIDGLTLVSNGGAQGVRGAYLTGGGPWSNIKVFVDTNATAASVYGVRASHSALDVGAALINLFVNVSGEYVPSTTVGSVVEGIRVESADILFKGVGVNVDRVEAQNVAGIRVITIPTASNPVPDVVVMSDVTLVVDGIQSANLGSGAIYGVRATNAALQLSRAKVDVRCVAGGYNACVGVRRQSDPSGLQPGALLLDQVSVVVGHENPADTSAQSGGYWGEGQARIVNSSIRVLRSPDGELQQGVQLQTADADVRVLNSTVEIESTVTPTADCVIAGSAGSAEFFGNHFRGDFCAAGATLTCAGNTKRGTGFLASTCP